MEIRKLTTKNGLTPLDVAQKKGNAEVASMLSNSQNIDLRQTVDQKQETIVPPRFCIERFCIANYTKAPG